MIFSSPAHNSVPKLRDQKWAKKLSILRSLFRILVLMLKTVTFKSHNSESI